MMLLRATLSWFADGSHYLGTGGVPHRLLQHVVISGASVGLAALIAVPIGVGLGHARRGGAIAVTLSNGGRAVPTVGVLILFAVGPLGIGNQSAIAALTLFAIPPILTNAYTGIRGVDPELREAARGMGMTGTQLLGKVELPLALPLVAAGVRTASVQVIATATLAALVGSGGLGRYIVDGFGRVDYPEVLAGAVCVAVLAVAVELLLGYLQHAVTPIGLRAGFVVGDSQVRPSAVGEPGSATAAGLDTGTGADTGPVSEPLPVASEP